MKKVLAFLLLMSGIGGIWAQQDSLVTDMAIDHDGNVNYGHIHQNIYCPVFSSEYLSAAYMTKEEADGKGLTQCQYCFEGKPYKFSSVYQPIYFSKIHEFSLNTDEESVREWTEAEGGFDSQSGAVWIGVIQERLNNDKINDIKTAHAAVVLNSIALGVNASAKMFAALRGNVRNVNTASISETNIILNAGFLTAHTKTVEDLEIAIVVKNITNREIQVNNESQGRVWHLLPGQALEFGCLDECTDLLRVEQQTADGPQVSYYELTIKNHLMKVKPIAQTGLWRSFRSLPFDQSQPHSLDPAENDSRSILYEYNLESGAHRKLQE